MLTVKRQALAKLLEGLSSLIDAYAAADPSFVSRSLDWLADGADQLQRVRLPVASKLSIARGRITAVRDGLRPAGILAPDTRPRKAARAICADALADVEQALRDTLDHIDQRLDDASTKMSQLVAVSHVKSPIEPLPDSIDRTTELRRIWATLQLSPETANMYAFLNASVRLIDRLLLLDEIIDNLTATDRQRLANGNSRPVHPPAFDHGHSAVINSRRR